MKILIIVLIVGIFFLQKVGTHGALLKSPYNKIYKVYHTIFNFVYVPMRKWIKPINIGRGLDLDVIPFFILISLLIIML